MTITKVEVLDNKWHHIHYKGKVHLVGSIMNIPAEDFDPKVWKSLEKPKKPTPEEIEAAKVAEVPSKSIEEKLRL